MRCTHCDYPLWNLDTPRCPECGRAFALREFRFRPGTVAFACVNCGRRYPGHGAQHLPAPPGNRCLKCHQPIDRDGMRVVLLRGDPATTEAIPVWRVPWEHRAQAGVWASWWRTCVMSLRRPREFGRRLGTYAPLDAPIYAVFTYLVGMIGAVVLGGLFAGVLSLLEGEGALAVVTSLPCMLIAAFLIACLWPLVTSILWGVGAHLILLAFGSRGRGVDGTFACFFYAQGPMALAGATAIPFVGPVLLVMLYLGTCALTAIMLASAHRVAVWQAVVAMVGPVVAAGVLFALGMLGLAAA